LARRSTWTGWRVLAISINSTTLSRPRSKFEILHLLCHIDSEVRDAGKWIILAVIGDQRLRSRILLILLLFDPDVVVFVEIHAANPIRDKV
jgi:hypothetical protein